MNKPAEDHARAGREHAAEAPTTIREEIAARIYLALQDAGTGSLTHDRSDGEAVDDVVRLVLRRSPPQAGFRSFARDRALAEADAIIASCRSRK